MSKTWFITGCSTGFGALLAEEAIKAGDNVVASARRVETLTDLAKQFGDKCLTVTLDVMDPGQRYAAVQKAIDRFGKIDVLVNNAGYGIIGTLEEAPEAEIRRVFETNFFGLTELTRVVLPHMRRARSGHIFNLSSVAGVVSSPGFGIYNATKFAVEGLSEALAGELAPLGIKVTLIEPGPFRTDFASRSLVVTKPIADYADSSGKMRDYINQIEGKQPGDPLRAARAILHLANLPQPPLRFVCGKIAVDRIRAKLSKELESLSNWQADSLATDFPS